MKKHSLKTRLSLNIIFVALLTVALISILSNIFINRQFRDYITKQQDQKITELLSNLSQQYDFETKIWDLMFLHTIGMYALHDGYIVKVYDRKGTMLWDAEVCDMTACTQLINDVTKRMRVMYPDMNGKFKQKDFDLIRDNQVIGMARILSFAPYFFNENDFHFMKTLNTLLVGSGALSLFLAIAFGCILAQQMSDPICKVAAVAKRMSDGDYAVRIEEITSIKELEELMSSVNHLARSLGSQENLRKQLTADVAHELRTPLTTIGTHIEAMVEGIWEPTPERLSSCHEEIVRISKLVCDLESLAKVESGNLRLNKTSVNLFELTEKVIRNFETEARSKKLHVSIEGKCPDVWADRDRISQVFINLFSNAVKYTPPGGTIRVILSEGDNSSLLVVEDDGAGIPQEELPFIFERFYRADKSRNRTSGGSGIGLAIVQSIVTAHGGKVRAESRLEHGSRFQVALPK